jgi:predicted ester cyclase
VIRSFVNSINAHNWDSLRILLAPQFIRHSNAGGAPEVRSAEELITYLKNEYVTFPDAEETLLDLVAEGESVAARSQFRGTQVGAKVRTLPPARCFPRPILRYIA